MTYRFPVVKGDRVAVAPHTDLFMSGRRFGVVLDTRRVPQVFNARQYLVEFTTLSGHTARYWLHADALLGAINAVPGDGSANPDSIGAGWPEEAVQC